ncbi:MAG: ribosome biogenesis GTP-binding protein YihA/YsxC, partial [Burkholderiales bacterium]
LMDARHPLTPPDERLLDWLRPFGLQQLALLTKSDKLSRAQGIAALQSVRRKLEIQVVLFSSTSGAGIEELREGLESWLRAPDAAAGNKRPPV